MKNEEIIIEISALKQRIRELEEAASQKKQAEEVLRESEDRFRSLVENMTDIIIVTDMNGRLLYANPALERVSGYGPEEFHQPEVAGAIYHPADVAILRDVRSRFQTSDVLSSLRFEYRLCAKSGIISWHSAIATRIVYRGQPAIQMISRDISERKRTEDALRYSEEKFALAFRYSPSAICFTTMSEGRFIDANNRFFRDLGYGRDEVIGRTGADLNLWVDLSQREAFRCELAGTGAIKDREYQFRSKTGEIHWGITSATIITIAGESCILTQTRDITDQKLAEQGHARLTAILDNTSDLVSMASPDGMCLHMNAAGRRMAGMGAEEDLRAFHISKVHPAWAWRIVEEEGIPTAMAQGVWEGETAIVNRDGAEIPVSQVIMAHRLPDGSLEYLSTIMRDITERKRTEEALRASESRLKSVSSNLPSAMLYQVVMQGDGTRRFTYLSDSVRQLHGISPEEGLADPALIYNRVHEDDIPLLIKAENEALKTLSMFKTDVRMKDPSGGIRWSTLASTPMLMEDGSVYWDGIEFVITDRKEAERALRNSEAQLNQAQRMAKIGSWEKDLLTNKIVWSDEMFRLFEIDRERSDISYEVLLELIHPEDRDAVKAVFEQEASTKLETTKIIHRLLMPDGRIKYIDTEGKTDFSPEGKPIRIVGTTQDITARKEVEAEIIRVKKHLENAQEYAHFGSWEWNPKTGNGYWSDEVFRLHHLPVKDGIPDFHTEYMDCVHPDDREEFMKTHTRNIEEKAETKMVFRTNPEVGPVRYLNANVKVILDRNDEIELLFGTCQDVTERIMQEKEYKQLIDGMTETVWVIDLNGNLIDVNKSAVDLLGYSKKELLARGIPSIDASLEREDVKALARAMPSDGIQKFETFHRTKGGKSFPVEIFSSLVTYQGKQAILSIARDISERKHSEEERKKLEDQLTQAQKMESIGRLAGGVAHDFNNMLSVIIGYAELASEKLALYDPLKDDLNEILKAAQQSAQITKQLLAFARKQTVAPRVVDLNHQLESMLKMLHRLIGEDIDLVWKPRANLWSINIDPTQIDQILANLCVNARDAIAGVGKLTIETENICLDPDDSTAHVDVAPGEYVMLAVSDNGCGMDKDTLDKLFEPFFTTKAKGKGTGLGLATIYGIVKQNNGGIYVYSEPKRGTTFKIYLPRHMGKPEHVRMEDPTGLAVQGCETILLVEDEPAILKMTVRMLKRFGYTIIAASTPGEALRLARENTGDIHLLITDVVMPEMNGRDLAINLLPLYPDVKHLFMSGYTADVIAHHGVLDKGVHFIQKPFSAKELADKVKEALEEQRSK